MTEPEVYTVEDIRRILGLGRSKTYEMIERVHKEKGPFRVIKIGRVYRVPKESFNRWITGNGE